MTRSTPRAARALLLAALVAAVGALVPTAATADDTTVAWAVSPADEAGNPDGTTRFELEVGPGEQVVEHVLVTNSSTVERTFRVYGADGFTTQSGGYDLGAAAAVASDVGAWVTTEAPTVTIPALESRPVAFTVAVPAGAAPGTTPVGWSSRWTHPRPMRPPGCWSTRGSPCGCRCACRVSWLPRWRSATCTSRTARGWCRSPGRMPPCRTRW
ncbi:WxL protein peptidoglycan domain-containing protein [Cellulomonas soli]